MHQIKLVLRNIWIKTNWIATYYRISANSFRGNYSFLNLALCTVTFTVHKSAETIQGRKLFKGGNNSRKYGTPTFINFWNYFQGLRSYYVLKRLIFYYISLHILRGYVYIFFLSNFPEATFIQGAMSIPDSRVNTTHDLRSTTCLPSLSCRTKNLLNDNLPTYLYWRNDVFIYDK